MEIPRETPCKPPRAFKWLLLNKLRLRRECRFQPHFFALDDVRDYYSIALARGCQLISEAQPPLGHFSKSLGQIQNLDSDPLMSGLKCKTTPGDTLPAPIDAWTRKMDVDVDGGRREFGLCRQRRGTESDMGTAANSLSGYHAPGLKKILACLRP